MRVWIKPVMKEGMPFMPPDSVAQPYLHGLLRVAEGNATFSPDDDCDGLPGLHDVHLKTIDGQGMLLTGIEITGGGRHYAQGWWVRFTPPPSVP